MKPTFTVKRTIGRNLPALRNKKMKVKLGFPKNPTYTSGSSPSQTVKGTSILDIAIYNEFGTEHIPSRPFLITSYNKNFRKYNKYIRDFLSNIKNMDNTDRLLKTLGLMGVTDIRNEITKWQDPVNAVSTIMQKGFDNPLVRRGNMRNAVSYEIEEK